MPNLSDSACDISGLLSSRMASPNAPFICSSGTGWNPGVVKSGNVALQVAGSFGPHEIGGDEIFVRLALQLGFANDVDIEDGHGLLPRTAAKLG